MPTVLAAAKISSSLSRARAGIFALRAPPAGWSKQGLLGVFLRAVETTVRQNSPEAPGGSRFGAVAFVHRFGSYLNSHVHFHILVTDGVFSADDEGAAIFHPAVDLDPSDFLAVQTKMRHRGLRWLHRHGHLDSVAVHTLDAPDHAGGWSVNASVTIPAGTGTAWNGWCGTTRGSL